LLGTAVFALALVACGDDDDDDDGGSGGTTTAAEEAPQGGSDPFEGAEQVYEGYEGDEADLPTSYPEPTETGDFTIGWLNPLEAQPVLKVEQDAAEAEVKRLGGKFIALDDQASVDKQVSNFQQLLARNVDAIFFAPFDPAAMEPLVKQAKAKGIPVVARDRTNTLDADAGAIDSQFWQGRDHNAYSQMKIMSELKPNGKIALIGFAIPVENIRFLGERQKYWAEQFGLEVVKEVKSKSDDAAGGEAAMASVLSENVDGVVCYTDSVCSGASAAARQAGQKPVTVGVGGGSAGLEGVGNGTLTATTQFDVVGQGVAMVDALYNLLQNPDEKIDPIVLIAPDQLINEDTIDNVVTWEDRLAELKEKPAP
jgi:ribose transport system substrate-binding protein